MKLLKKNGRLVIRNGRLVQYPCPDCCGPSPGQFCKATSPETNGCGLTIGAVEIWVRDTAMCNNGGTSVPVGSRRFRYGGLCFTLTDECLSLAAIPPGSIIVDDEHVGACVPDEDPCTEDYFFAVDRRCSGEPINSNTFICAACVWSTIQAQGGCPVLVVDSNGTDVCALPSLLPVYRLEDLPSGAVIRGQSGDCTFANTNCCQCQAQLDPDGCQNTTAYPFNIVANCGINPSQFTCVFVPTFFPNCCCRNTLVTGTAAGESSRVFTDVGFNSVETRTYTAVRIGITWTINWRQTRTINGVLFEDFSNSLMRTDPSCMATLFHTDVPFFRFIPPPGFGYSGGGGGYYSCDRFSEIAEFATASGNTTETIRWTQESTIARNPGPCQGVSCLTTKPFPPFAPPSGFDPEEPGDIFG